MDTGMDAVPATGMAAGPAGAPIIELSGVVKSFGPVSVLKGVDLKAHPGRVTALVGDNGAGKSTLIKGLAGVQPYDGGVMQPLRESLSRLLAAYEPNPALIVDGLWNLIEANSAASLLWDGVDPELLEPPINMLRLGVHPGGLPRISSMTAACNAPLIHRLKRRSREDADPALAQLIEEVEAYLPGEPPTAPATQPVVSLRLQTPIGEVELFTVIATLGAPLDVTAANLAIETFLPMGETSAARLAELRARRR